MNISSQPAFPLPQMMKVINAVQRNDSVTLLPLLHQLATSPAPQFPADFLRATAYSLKANDYSGMSLPFQRQEFIGTSGQFLLVAPYTMQRKGQVLSALSAIWGEVIPHARLPLLVDAIQELFQELRQTVPTVLPVRAHATAGVVSGDGGEAFVVPNGWGIPNSYFGPALNDTTEQLKRFALTRHCIGKIFEPKTASLLLEYFDRELEVTQIQQLEYQLHDAGHACGIGLNRKLDLKLLNTYWYRAVDEWRSDGVALVLAQRLLSPDDAFHLHCFNVCARFGMDAHRSSGMKDHDVCATLLTFETLVQGGALVRAQNGQLAFAEATPDGILRAFEPMRRQAVSLTRQELKLDDPLQVKALYDSIEVSPEIRARFQEHLIAPCQGIFEQLP